MKSRLAFAVAVFLASAALRGGPPSPETYGTTRVSKQRVAFTAFTPIRSSTTFDLATASLTRFATNPGGGFFGASPVLPSGALLLGVTFDVCDTSPSAEVGLQIFASDNSGVTASVIGSAATSGEPGCARVAVDLSGAGFVVDNDASHVLLVIALTTGDELQSFAGATVSYRLQVSPAPAVASFNDVPTSHPFFQYIEALKASGITGGCQAAPPLYCPDAALTRGQMAVFLAKALGLQFE